MNRIDALLRVYPPSWRARHEDEFRDALSLTVDPSGRLPFRELRSAVAGGLRVRARGESTTPRELVRGALSDSYIFVSGMLVGIPTFLAVRDGLPVSGFPAILFLIPLALFVSSIASAASFRRVALASGPFSWLAMSGLVTRGSNTNSSRQLFSPGAIPFAAIGLLSFAGLAMFFRHRRWIGAVLQVPTLGLAFRGLWMLHRPSSYLGTQGAFVEVRMAWATGFLALLLCWTAVAFVCTSGPTQRRRPRRLHGVSFGFGLIVVTWPGVISAIAVGGVLMLAWWNPRPALVVVTWPALMIVANTTPLVWFDGTRSNDLQLRFLLPLVAGVAVAQFLRQCTKRVHRLT